MQSSSQEHVATVSPPRPRHRGSLRTIPGRLLPALIILACTRGPTPRPPAPQLIEADPPRDARALVFERNGCHACHSVAVLGVRARDSTAPDLSLAGARVPALYGVSLAQFLQEPTGTMAVVLDLEIQLSLADRDSIVATLERLARNQPR